MGDNTNDTLVRLSDSDLMVGSPAEDVRGLKVVDRNGDDVGSVDELVIDPQEAKVRFLEVGSGGFLGIGEKKRLIPVDAVTSVDDKVHIDVTRDSVAGSHEFDPDLMPEQEYYRDLYDYYGYAPYWGPGYIYPGYPYR